MKNSRIWLLLGLVMLIPIVPWLLIGAPFEGWVQGLLAQAEASGLQRWWAAVLGVLMLAVDSFLPVPSTLVMSGLGLAFGAGWGGVLASLGLILSGLAAYGACRAFGAGLARRIAGEKELERVQSSMQRVGALTVAVTRSVPVIQEATACLAGLARMRFGTFCLGLVAGCVPTGFAYAAIGASALRSQTTALILSVVVPAVTWPVIYLALKRANGLPKRETR